MAVLVSIDEVVAILLFILYSTGLYAYQTDDSWFPGKVKLLNGTELIGDIHCNLGNQTARVRINGQPHLARSTTEWPGDIH